MTTPPGFTDPLENLSRRIDYLQGQWTRSISPLEAGGWTCTWGQSAQLTRVRGIGVLNKEKPSDARPPAAVTKEDREGRLSHMLPRSADVIAGLHGRTGLAFQIGSGPRGLQVRIGVWSSRPDSAELGYRQQMLTSLLGGCYTDVTCMRIDPGSDDDLDATDHAGYVMGIPDPAPGRPDDPATPIDRLIRALTGSRWSITVVAHPVDEPGRRSLRDGLLNEARLTHATAGNSDASPPVRAYQDMLESGLGAMNRAGTVGAWRTAVYLRGDEAGYQRLAATWVGIFSGPYSTPLPMRVIESPIARDLARVLALPDIDGPVSPSAFRYPFAAQTVLTSYQLAAYIHLPEREHPGYAVEQVPAFDTWTRDQAPGTGIRLGYVVDRGHVTSTEYRLDTDTLTKHAFVSGVTGAGKTNTVVALLSAAREHGAGFLVLEPAKTEYRSLLNDPRLSSNLRVFTAGDETVSPMGINPLEVPPGTTVATHIDLIRALFSVSFALWSPLPQILEQALHLAYADRGWDVTGNRNARQPAAGACPGAFPTLSDLQARTEDVINRSGYDPEAVARIRGALSTKLSGLRIGGKGRMLNTSRSTPASTLFDEPAVIELEGLGDQEDKAFLMGLLLIRLAEHRRAQGRHDTLRHLLVVEEAHRLLSAKPSGTDKDFGAAGGKAVETFTDLLAEVRAYGQGLIIADQVPSRLAPEVIKNSGLKVAHRLVAEDDRKAIGTSTAMNETQIRSLATLSPAGRAAVFSEGEDAPILIQVADVQAALAPVTNEELRQRAVGRDPGRTDDCCGHSTATVCDLAALSESHDSLTARVSQIAVSITASPITAPHMWDDISLQISDLFPAADEADPRRTGWRCVAWWSARSLARRRGAQRGWSYPQEQSFADALEALLTALALGHNEHIRVATETFAVLNRQLFARDLDPFPGCHAVCADRTCLFRLPLEDLLRDPATNTRARAAVGTEDLRPLAWELADQVTANPPMSWPADHARPAADARWRAALCAGQISFARHTPAGFSARSGLEHFLATELGPQEEQT